MGRINTNRFIKACDNSGGIISLIAKRLSVGRQTVYSYIQRNPEMGKYVEDARDAAMDVAESKILNSVVKAQPEGSMEDVKWYLSRMSKRTHPEVSVNQTTIVEPTYKFIIERPNDIRNTVETEPKATTGA